MERLTVEDWVRRALAKWPDVPALYGWLQLDRRGRWRIRGELITRPQIVDTINRNYEADAQGRWFFQNGPQRGYVQLETAPLVLRAENAVRLVTHTGLPVAQIAGAWLDEDGALWLATEHGVAALADTDADWTLTHLRARGRLPDEDDVAAALARPSRSDSGLQLALDGTRIPLGRLDRADAPAQLGFVRDPQPDPATAV